jgi:hypothetical protein
MHCSNYIPAIIFSGPTPTPASYPQVQAPIVSNPNFWERIGSGTMATDMLFFGFYYQQVNLFLALSNFFNLLPFLEQ